MSCGDNRRYDAKAKQHNAFLKGKRMKGQYGITQRYHETDVEKTEKSLNKLTKNTKSNKYQQKKINFLKIYLDTLKKCLNYDDSKCEKYYIDQLPQPDENSTPCKIEVLDIDTLDAAQKFDNVVILNMCSEYQAGGGVTAGKSAQEECIFRKTTAYNSLSKIHYPLIGSILYSPQIHIIKNNKHDDIEAKAISMISVAAIRHPKVIDDDYVFMADKELMASKIESIFKLAVMKNHRNIILGALGCGAYHNPVNPVVSMFKDVLTKYQGHFDNIVFAVLVAKDTDVENFEVFKTLAN